MKIVVRDGDYLRLWAKGTEHCERRFSVRKQKCLKDLTFICRKRVRAHPAVWKHQKTAHRKNNNWVAPYYGCLLCLGIMGGAATQGLVQTCVVKQAWKEERRKRKIKIKGGHTYLEETMKPL